MNTSAPTTSRPEEIVKDYLLILDQHMAELKAGTADRTFEIQDLADLLHIHPTHLSNTLHERLGQSPCALYEERLTGVAKELLSTTGLSIGAIAAQLYFDPSNFTKFFKNYTGVTPKEYRKSLL